MTVTRWLVGIYICAFIAVAGMNTASAAETEGPITVSAAISLKDALEEIIPLYEKQTGEQVRLNLGASGKLAAQIEHGAPVDLFISAANAQVDQLIKANLADATTRCVVARNRLVLIVPTDAVHPPKTFADLADTAIKHLAMGQPRTVPAGMYAQEVLDHLGLTQSLKQRLVYGANVRQVLAYVERGEVDAGIVYQSDAVHAGKKVKVVATAATTWHDAIVYPAVVIQNAKHPHGAARFAQFLLTPVAEKILEKQGFVAANPPTTAPSEPTEKPNR